MKTTQNTLWAVDVMTWRGAWKCVRARMASKAEAFAVVREMRAEGSKERISIKSYDRSEEDGFVTREVQA